MIASLSTGYNLSISVGQYRLLTGGYVIPCMQTVFETRRARLKMLVDKYGSVANVNRALGWEETNGRLYQIHNRSIRSDRGTPYEMGDPTAREIETKLDLDEGWMDTPPTFEELDPDPRIANLLSIARTLKATNRNDELEHLVEISHTFAQPEAKRQNGK